MELMHRFSWVFAAIGALCGVVFLSLVYLYGGVTDEARYIGIFGAVAFVGFALLDREQLSEGANSRAGQRGLVSVLLVGVVAFIAIFGYRIARDHDERWDWTGAKRFTLSDESTSVAAGLQRPVTIKAFFAEGSLEGKRFEELTEGYVNASDKLTVEMIDPVKNPIEAERWDIVVETGTVVIVAGEDEQRLEARFDETSLTEALIRLESGEDHLLCWAVGYGEADPDDDREADGYGFAVIRLEGRNYTVKKLKLPVEGIAPDCEALLVVRPTIDWLPNAREALAAWIGGGGRALVMLEAGATPELAADMERYGVLMADDLVLEDSPEHRQAGVDPSSLLLFEENFESHPITAPLHGVIDLSYARSVDVDPEAEGVMARRLLSSSPYAWAETNFDDPALIGPNEGEKQGDVGLAVAVEVLDPTALDVSTEPQAAPALEGLEGAPPTLPSLVAADWSAKPGGRLVVIGDSFPGSNVGVYRGNNGDFVYNSIAWLLDAEDELTERPNEAENQLLNLSAIQQGLVVLISMFFLPGFAALLALITLVRRRRL
ncbi:MAG: hypothetical protein EP330_14930 [Deltaproteobacteria bacterium]|nr:MAG: hypothetical protein EP330_14930 [Deltaproteobacteria bacterium]